MRTGTLTPPAALLERDAEMVRLDAALAAAGGGHGGMVAIEGPAGAGKTALLATVASRATAAGFDVRVARASELECDFAFGGARQLLAESGPSDSVAVNGSAAAAVPVLARSGAALDPPPAFAVLDGLTARVGMLADHQPVALLIDDAHWLDAPTLRWLDYLRARAERLRVLIVVTVREAASPRSPALDRMLADPHVEPWTVAPLSPSAIATLLQTRLGTPPEPALVAGCAQATAGNAFAVCELISALDLEGADQVTAAAHLTRRVPRTIARSIRSRLSRLDPDAVRVARVLAVLGDGAPLHRVAALAQLSHERTSEMADVIAAADLIVRARPLAFVHPLVRSAIEDDLAPGIRARLHAEAADHLAAQDADPEAVAAHLLRSDPVGSPDTVARLRAAARVALQRGAPDTAVVYLARAHAEPPAAADRGDLLHELGRAELLDRDPTGLRHLEEALERAPDPVARARVGIDLFDGMTFTGRWPDALRLVAELRGELGGLDPGVALALEMRLALGLVERDPRQDPEAVRRIEALAAATPAARPLLLLLALVLALQVERCDEVPALVAEGLQGDRFLAEHTADSMLAVYAVDALVFIDALPAAGALADALCEDAARRGLVLGAVAGCTHRGLVALRAGRVDAAERDLRDALGTAREHELHFTLPFICGYLAEALAELGQLDAAAEVLASVPGASLELHNPAAATLLGARGAIHRARGDRDAAISDLRACGLRYAEIGCRNPVVAPWRSTLALALPADARDEAETLLAQELSLARAAGIGRGIAVALRAQAQLRAGETAVELLQEAVAVLETSPAALERARTLAHLGAALRRAGRIAEARERLRAALDGASRCGASALAGAITAELHIAGARPRGPWLSGLQALTPSELRVARLATRGLTNREIAAELVITPKTVKHHLGAVYRKLNIAGRQELDGAQLARQTAADRGSLTASG